MQQNQKYRLALFTNQFPSPVSTFFARDVRGLLEAGIDVDVFAFYPYDPGHWIHVPSVLTEEIFSSSKVHHIDLLRDLPALRLDLSAIRTFLRETTLISASAIRFGLRPLGKSIYVCLKGLVWAQQNRGIYDHILAYWGNYSATCAYLFRQMQNHPVPLSVLLHAGIDLYGDRIFFREKLRRAHAIITVCEFNKQYLEKLYPDEKSIRSKIYVHHLGLDLNEYIYQPIRDDQQKLIAVGRLVAQKGFSYLLRAMQILISKNRNLKLEIVGDGPDRRKLKYLAAKLDLSSAVTFVDWLTPDQTRERMARATILVHPSPHLGDAVPTVIKEAMALGTPVISTTIAGIPELLDNGRCGILVPPGDVVALAKAIESLLQDPTERLRYAELARKRAEAVFDFRRNGKRLASILQANVECV